MSTPITRSKSHEFSQIPSTKPVKGKPNDPYTSQISSLQEPLAEVTNIKRKADSQPKSERPIGKKTTANRSNTLLNRARRMPIAPRKNQSLEKTERDLVYLNDALKLNTSDQFKAEILEKIFHRNSWIQITPVRYLDEAIQLTTDNSAKYRLLIAKFDHLRDTSSRIDSVYQQLVILRQAKALNLDKSSLDFINSQIAIVTEQLSKSYI